MKTSPNFIAPLSGSFPLGAGPDVQMVTVSAGNVRLLGAMLSVLSPVLHELMALPPELVERVLGDEGPTHGDVLALLTLLADRPQVAFEFVAIASQLQVAQVEQLMPDVFAYLFAVCVQVNGDFFARALPTFRRAEQLIANSGVMAAGGASGGTPATPGPTSSTS